MTHDRPKSCGSSVTKRPGRHNRIVITPDGSRGNDNIIGRDSSPLNGMTTVRDFATGLPRIFQNRSRERLSRLASVGPEWHGPAANWRRDAHIFRKDQPHGARVPHSTARGVRDQGGHCLQALYECAPPLRIDHSLMDSCAGPIPAAHHCASGASRFSVSI